jgi:putative ABC transport system ATP-binding protein
MTLLMTTLVQPRLVLLDEHTASLDPKTALKVLELTRTLIEENGITSLMVTHNMEQALRVGSRTIMMHEGKIILDIKGEQREKMTVPRLIEMFHEVSGEKMQTDRILLT